MVNTNTTKTPAWLDRVRKAWQIPGAKRRKKTRRAAGRKTKCSKKGGKMLQKEREVLKQSRREEMKSSKEKDLVKYANLLTAREIPLFEKAVEKMKRIIPEIGRCPFEVIKAGSQAAYRLLQDLNAFSQAIHEIEKKAEKYLDTEKSEKGK